MNLALIYARNRIGARGKGRQSAVGSREEHKSLPTA
jgi:hypothetical protein